MHRVQSLDKIINARAHVSLYTVHGFAKLFKVDEASCSNKQFLLGTSSSFNSAGGEVLFLELVNRFDARDCIPTPFLIFLAFFFYRPRPAGIPLLQSTGEAPGTSACIRRPIARGRCNVDRDALFSYKAN